MAPILPCGRNSKTANGKSLSTRPGQSIRPEESSDRGIYRVTRVAFMSNDGKTHEGLLLLLEGLLFQKLQQTRGRTYVESRCRQDVASYVSTMRSFGMQYLFKSLLADATCHNVGFGER
jgi:hypothetical protein